VRYGFLLMLAGVFLTDFWLGAFFDGALAFPDDFAAGAFRVGACADGRPGALAAPRAGSARCEPAAAVDGPYRRR
jgi:hypothetical protein